MMEMKGRVWTITLLLVWISHTAISGGTEDDSRIVGAPPPASKYPIVKFMVMGANEASYGAMIARLRELLSRNRESIDGIVMLPELGSVRASERYILLDMSVGPEAADAITFAIHVANVYVVAYHVGRTNTRHFFKEAATYDRDARQLLFTTAAVTSTTVISTNYLALGKLAGTKGRRELHLGLPNLDQAIRNIIGGTSGKEEKVARGLIVSLQMVAEAVRFGQLERTIRQAPTPFIPDTFLYELVTSWKSLSTAVQTSVGSAFRSPVVVGGVQLDNTNSVTTSIGLFVMLFICRSDRSTTAAAAAAAAALSLEPPLHHGLQVMMSRRSTSELQPEAEPEQCRVSFDPRTRITGRDGLCVEVEGFRYSDNNPVVVGACRRSDWRNQLWTWRPDGRIVSLEKCLTASGNKAGSSVVIRECDPLDSASPSRWRMDEQGNLIHIYSRLVLTALGRTPSRLTLEARALSSFQAWTSTNETTAHDVSIIGQNNQCIYYNGKRGVYTEDCSRGQVATRQRWRLYPDSTIRPINWLAGCLELRSLYHPASRYNYIQAGNCNNWPEYHRWIFTREGAIQNLASSLVVDADMAYPGYLQAAPFAQAGNQIWRTQYI